MTRRVIQARFAGLGPQLSGPAHPPPPSGQRIAPASKLFEPTGAMVSTVQRRTPESPMRGGVHSHPGAIAVADCVLCTHGPGTQLPEDLKKRFEKALRSDFSQVRVHVGAQAKSIGAIAFTSGNDIYFAPGHYQPDSPVGRELIGHELVHVIQQKQNRVRNPFGSGVAIVQDKMLEDEASRLAGIAVKAIGATSPQQRWENSRPVANRLVHSIIQPMIDLKKAQKDLKKQMAETEALLSPEFTKGIPISGRTQNVEKVAPLRDYSDARETQFLKEFSAAVLKYTNSREFKNSVSIKKNEVEVQTMYVNNCLIVSANNHEALKSFHDQIMKDKKKSFENFYGQIILSDETLHQPTGALRTSAKSYVAFMDPESRGIYGNLGKTLQDIFNKSIEDSILLVRNPSDVYNLIKDGGNYLIFYSPSHIKGCHAEQYLAEIILYLKSIKFTPDYVYVQGTKRACQACSMTYGLLNKANVIVENGSTAGRFFGGASCYGYSYIKKIVLECGFLTEKDVEKFQKDFAKSTKVTMTQQTKLTLGKKGYKRSHHAITTAEKDEESDSDGEDEIEILKIKVPGIQNKKIKK